MIAKSNRLFRIVGKLFIDNSVVFAFMYPQIITSLCQLIFNLALPYEFVNNIYKCNPLLFKLKIGTLRVERKVCRHVGVSVQSTTCDKGYGVIKLHTNWMQNYLKILFSCQLPTRSVKRN